MRKSVETTVPKELIRIDSIFLESIEHLDFESGKRSKIQAHREQNGNGTRTLCQYRKEWQWI